MRLFPERWFKVALCAALAFGSSNWEARAERDPFDLLKLTSFSQLAGRFRQIRRFVDLGIHIEFEGQFEILKDPKLGALLHWDVLKPQVSYICIDRQGLSIRSLVGKKETKKRIQFSEVGRDVGAHVAKLITFVGLDRRRIEEEFHASVVGGKLRLIPKAIDQNPFSEVLLSVNGRGFVDQIEIKEKTNDLISISFFDLKVDSDRNLKSNDLQCTNE